MVQKAKSSSCCGGLFRRKGKKPKEPALAQPVENKNPQVTEEEEAKVTDQNDMTMEQNKITEQSENMEQGQEQQEEEVAKEGVANEDVAKEEAAGDQNEEDEASNGQRRPSITNTRRSTIIELGDNTRPVSVFIQKGILESRRATAGDVIEELSELTSDEEDLDLLEPIADANEDIADKSTGDAYGYNAGVEKEGQDQYSSERSIEVPPIGADQAAERGMETEEYPTEDLEDKGDQVERVSMEEFLTEPLAEEGTPETEEAPVEHLGEEASAEYMPERESSEHLGEEESTGRMFEEAPAGHFGDEEATEQVAEKELPEHLDAEELTGNLNEEPSEHLNEEPSEHVGEEPSEHLNEEPSEHLNEESPEYMGEESAPEHLVHESAPEHLVHESEPEHLVHESEPEHLVHESEPEHLTYEPELEQPVEEMPTEKVIELPVEQAIGKESAEELVGRSTTPTEEPIKAKTDDKLKAQTSAISK